MTGVIRPILTERVIGTPLERVSRASTVRLPPTDVTVDLDAAPQRANIVRDGKEIVPPVANPTRSADLLQQFVPMARILEPRSVRQSIAPGTLVSRGTAVDVDFLAPDKVKVGIFDGVHLDLRNALVPSLANLLNDPEVAAALAKPDLTDAEKLNLRTKLATVSVTVDDNVPEKSLGAAITGLRAAQAFR